MVYLLFLGLLAKWQSDNNVQVICDDVDDNVETDNKLVCWNLINQMQCLSLGKCLKWFVHKYHNFHPISFVYTSFKVTI